MAQFESGLEPARQDFPEVNQEYGHQHYQQQPQHYQQAQQPYQQVQQSYQQPQPYHPQPYDTLSATPAKQDPPPPPSTYGSQTVASPFSANSQPVTAHNEPKTEPASARTVCGCGLLIFILSCIIAFLSAAVIGLAAATGVEAQRASSAESSLAVLSASGTSATASAASASSTAVANIDDSCSEDPSSADKTTYTSFSLLGGLKFTRYCNKDAPNTPLLSLFTADFDSCMDACAAYTKYVPGSFGNTANATCAAVSFIPAWTSKTTAKAGGAPGNCYLKSGPQNATALNTPNIGTDCHAAIMVVGGASS